MPQLNSSILGAALCILPVHSVADLNSRSQGDPVSVNSEQVMQGDVFTVFLDPHKLNVPLLNPFKFPVPVTIGPHPEEPLFGSVTATVIAPTSTSVLFSVPRSAPAGPVHFGVSVNGIQVPGLAFSISVLSSPPNTGTTTSETITSAISPLSASVTLPIPVTTPIPTMSTLTVNGVLVSVSITDTILKTESIGTSTSSHDETTPPNPLSSSTNGIPRTSELSVFSSGPITTTIGSVVTIINVQTSSGIPSTGTSDPNRNHRLSAGQVSGIVVGLLIPLILLVLLFCWRKKRARRPITFPVDHYPFGFMAEKSTREGGNNVLVDSHQSRRNPGDLEEETFSNSGSTPPQYPTSDITETPVEKQTYGRQNLEELQEQRNKMRNLIGILKERPMSVSGGSNLTNDGRFGYTEVTPLRPVRGMGQ